MSIIDFFEDIKYPLGILGAFSLFVVTYGTTIYNFERSAQRTAPTNSNEQQNVLWTSITS